LKATTLLFASLLATASAAATPTEQARTLDFCDEPARLVLIADKPARLEELDRRLGLLEAPVCVRRGPHAGAFLLKGSLAAMDVGVIPQGEGSALLVQSPRYFTLPLTAYVEAGN
jgi:hypothetical protein